MKIMTLADCSGVHSWLWVQEAWVDLRDLVKGWDSPGYGTAIQHTGPPYQECCHAVNSAAVKVVREPSQGPHFPIIGKKP